MLGDFLINGQPATTANVGDTIQLIIPGYSRIWLVQTQNGNIQYNDVYAVPSNPYILRPQDVGYFQGTAYTVTPQNTKGQLISSWTFTVHDAGFRPESLIPLITPPPPGQPPLIPPTPIIPSDGGGALPAPPEEVNSGGLLGLDQSTLLLIGAGILIYFLFVKK